MSTPPPNTELSLTVLASRVAHGARHMPARDLIPRLAVLALGIAVSLWLLNGTTPAAALGTMLITAITAAISALELHTAALICERDQNTDGTEDQGNEFGAAA
ncbi:hypothetical protein [Nocardiopsis sp. YSL2]|uniref:hypothetical protein n=1 Tax=Nocardiopsis sp. YSL2 TaxID=2939492 RepID=UPI0026F4675E|nr:hypothetical protein [Nocardiopsis sp. YSL2]